MDGKKTMKDYKNHQKSHTGKCDVPSHLWCCAFGLFAFSNTFAFFHSQKTVHSNDVHSKLVQTWSTSLSSENILNSDSAGNTIPLIIYIQLLSITYAYKLDHWLSNRSYGIFKVSAGSQQVTLVRERYRQDAASGSLLPLNTFHFSLVWQAPGEHTDIHDLSSPGDVGGFECVCVVGNNLESSDSGPVSAACIPILRLMGPGHSLSPQQSKEYRYIMKPMNNY